MSESRILDQHWLSHVELALHLVSCGPLPGQPWLAENPTAWGLFSPQALESPVTTPYTEPTSVHGICAQDHPEVIEHGGWPALLPPDISHLSCPIPPCPLQGQGFVLLRLGTLPMTQCRGPPPLSPGTLFPTCNVLPKVPAWSWASPRGQPECQAAVQS